MVSKYVPNFRGEEHSLKTRKKLSGKIAIMAGIFLIGIPFGFSLANQFLQDGTAPFIFLLFLAFWIAIATLISRSRLAIFVSLYAIVWLMGIGITALAQSPLWLLLPLGLSLILAALYQSIVGKKKNPQPQPTPSPQPQAEGHIINNYISVFTQPPQASYQPYQQGYQPPQPSGPLYHEGGQHYQYHPHQGQYEQPQVQYPKEMQ